MTSERKLIDLAEQVVTDEEVLAAGVLQPQGAMDAMGAGLTAGSVGDVVGGPARVAVVDAERRPHRP
jgi:hypothetical protein